jgi:hypothetical protein
VKVACSSLQQLWALQLTETKTMIQWPLSICHKETMTFLKRMQGKLKKEATIHQRKNEK